MKCLYPAVRPAPPGADSRPMTRRVCPGPDDRSRTGPEAAEPACRYHLVTAGIPNSCTEPEPDPSRIIIVESRRVSGLPSNARTRLELALRCASVTVAVASPCSDSMNYDEYKPPAVPSGAAAQGAHCPAGTRGGSDPEIFKLSRGHTTQRARGEISSNSSCHSSRCRVLGAIYSVLLPIMFSSVQVWPG